MVSESINYKMGLLGGLFFGLISYAMGNNLFWISVFVLSGFVFGVVFSAIDEG